MLSSADSRVLAQVFDPESALVNAEIVVDSKLPADRCIHDIGLLRHLKTAERSAIAAVERFEVSRRPGNCKEEVYKLALAALDDLITAQPRYASARNNRAQLRRWRFGDGSLLCQKTTHVEVGREAEAKAIVEDLKTSISLASPTRSQDAVSPSQGRLLAQAYTQLGALYYAAFTDCKAADVKGVTGLEESNWMAERFGEEASRAFFLGGLYGSEVAKALAVHTNPHARLCGSIVREAMQQELASGQ